VDKAGMINYLDNNSGRLKRRKNITRVETVICDTRYYDIYHAETFEEGIYEQSKERKKKSR